MCLEANGDILGTCLAWALALAKKSHFFRISNLFCSDLLQQNQQFIGFKS